MSQFATEFLVSKTFGTAQFAGQVLAWLRGAKQTCRLFDGLGPADIEGDDIRLSNAAETLHLRAVGRGGRLGRNRLPL